MTDIQCARKAALAMLRYEASDARQYAGETAGDITRAHAHSWRHMIALDHAAIDIANEARGMTLTAWRNRRAA
jgi:hypothetical protein